MTKRVELGRESDRKLQLEQELGVWTPPPSARPNVLVFARSDGSRLMYEVISCPVDFSRLDLRMPPHRMWNTEPAHDGGLCEVGTEAEVLMSTNPEILQEFGKEVHHIELVRLRLRRVA